MYFGFAQLSKTHYIPPLTYSQFGNANPEDQYIYISTPSNSNVTYTIKPVGQPAANYITGTFSNTTPQEIYLGTGSGQLFIPSTSSSVVTNNRGYIIEADATIYVSVRMNAGGGAQAGALVSKGLSALGTVFRVGCYTNENPQDNYLNFVSIMATEDNTQVTFSDLPAGLIIKNHTGTTPVNISLNKGESYTLATNSFDSTVNRDGLIGCLVSSTKPIVVNTGSANGSFSNGTGRDYGIDQIVGLDKVGTEYIFVKGDGSVAWENVLIVAHTDNTSININGNAPVATINAGQYYLIEGNQFSLFGNMYVQTSQPVFAYQGVGATTSEANQGMFFVPPLSCETRGNLDNIAQIQKIGTSTYIGGISIVTKDGATVTVNNLPISSFSTVGPYPVTGKPDYVTYKVTGLSGNISVQSSDELYCAYFNYNGAATSGSFYSGFPSAPEINFDAQFVTLGNCIPNIKLSAANIQNFDSFKWLFDDGTGSGFIEFNTTDAEITPTLPGKYKLIGIIACTGEQLESIEVPVSICPDDIDNDGIIDNIDIDNDNDGILNCTESKGDVIMDLSNTREPRLQFQDGSINNSLATDNIVLNRSSAGTNSIQLTATGKFTSTIPPDSNGENIYSLSFIEPVNVKFLEDISSPHTIISDEYFIVGILPLNKNITLIDPDNRLLVDSNYDGIFETGVTIISGSEIHFKFNPSPTATTPYQFLGNSVDAFSFTHKLSNITNTSIFNGITSLTCFKNDNDLDGLEDSLDLDSDNDGIPDFVENQGTLVTLSIIDADLNGLDDVYNINATPIDSDSDGVPDFYDLDSDNDGIYDLLETGQLGTLSDTNVDGIVDGNFGINGWADAVETFPDSNLINFIPNDLDSDSIFSYLDLDSDGDDCSDVIEAGFSDGNGDTILGDLIATTDTKGKVTNASDGYTLPNTNYLIAAPIIVLTQPINTESCESTLATISLNSVTFDSIQWEVSTDGIIWNSIIDDTIYSGSSSLNLTITSTPLSFNNNQYRAFLNLAGNSCGLYSDEIVLTVFQLPVANNPNTYSQCDDASNDGQAFFNLELNSIKQEINPNYIVDGLTFTFYEDQTEAETNGIAIPNPSNYQDSPGFIPETVWIRVENPNGCFRVVPLTLEVSPSSAALSVYNPNSIYQCDDGMNLRDGIATFDLTNIRNYISTTIFSTFNVTVHFYESQSEAELETNEILNFANHQNSNSPNSQDIWVRVKSDLGNNCLGLQNFQNLLIVEALPIANVVPNQIVCDNDSVVNDGRYAFNTSQIDSIILNGQSLSNVTINYSYFDLDGITIINTNSLPNPLLTFSQTVTVRVTNNNTLDPDGGCFDETKFDFIINAEPSANPVAPQLICDGDAGDIDNDGIFAFDTSTFKSTVLGSQSGMDVYFDYIDENNNSVVNSTSLPNPLNSRTQSINVTVRNPLNLNCIASTTIILRVNPLPDFEVDSPQIVCTTDPTFSVELDPIEASIVESFTYEWFFKDGSFLSNSPTLTVSTPGKYSITLTKTDGSGCARTRDIIVDASEKATITQNDVTIVDISENNSVTINTTNLGQGNYEFGLREVGSPFINYQSEPIFKNVKPGFYTIYIQDVICGITTMDISVIGHAKYFTPNNDGFNDYWQIKGVNSTNQPNSTVLIFDRFGKLIKQISVNSIGWDGTFNGKMLPTDDYWFKVFLEDGREFSGHFTLKR